MSHVGITCLDLSQFEDSLIMYVDVQCNHWFLFEQPNPLTQATLALPFF